MRPFTTSGTDSIVRLPAASASSCSRKVQAGASFATLCTSICFNGEYLCAWLSWPVLGQSDCAFARRRGTRTMAAPIHIRCVVSSIFHPQQYSEHFGQLH